MHWEISSTTKTTIKAETFSPRNLVCPYCLAKGEFNRISHFEKKAETASYLNNYDIWQCSHCVNHVFIYWFIANSFFTSEMYPKKMHAFVYFSLPSCGSRPSGEEEWPQAASKAYIEAKDSLDRKNYNAAATMARRTVQIAARFMGGKGKDLKKEINDLFQKGLLTKSLKDWADVTRFIGNSGAHPDPTESEDEFDVVDVSDAEAKSAVKFAYYFLHYLFTVPAEIKPFLPPQKNDD